MLWHMVDMCFYSAAVYQNNVIHREKTVTSISEAEEKKISLVF